MRIVLYKSGIKKDRVPTVIRRLQFISQNRIYRVPRLFHFGFVCGTQEEYRVRLEFERIGGQPIHHLPLANTEHMAEEILEITRQWRIQNFVHGDLSLRNLIYWKDQLWAIDWVLDLDRRQGTPLFWNGILPKTHSTDDFSAKQIASILRSNPKLE
ncbi:MAG: RIO1 family regulatory kinase/ATPase [Bacteriovoracia bacterium]